MSFVSDVMLCYDGSFDGFLCCVYYSFYNRQMPIDIVCNTNFQPSFYQIVNIETDIQKAARVYGSFSKKIGNDCKRLIEDTFLSFTKSKEMIILKFLYFAYSTGPSVLYMLAHKDVSPLIKAQRYLLNETHLLKGFLRFSDYNGFLAAEIEPRNFVLPRLAPHFCNRYPNERFLIYDKSHSVIFAYKDHCGQIMPVDNIVFPPPDEIELKYRKMWQQFYNTIEIKPRHNEKCRMTHMPKRYWNCMTEFLQTDAVQPLPPPAAQNNLALIL